MGWHGHGAAIGRGGGQTSDMRETGRPGGGQAGSAYHFALTDGSIVIVWYNS